MINSYKSDLSLYVLFTDKVLKDASVVLQMKKEDIVIVAWIHYINKYIFKLNYINVVKTSLYMKDIGVEWRLVRIRSVLRKVEERGYLTKLGHRYVLDDRIGYFLQTVSRMFTDRVIKFDESVNDPERVLKFRMPKRKFNRRKQGRPFGAKDSFKRKKRKIS